MVATSGPHQGQTPADTALSQGHIILAARLDSAAAEVASPYGWAGSRRATEYALE